jgi:hypothetical protein
LTEKKNITSAISFGFYWRKLIIFCCFFLIAVWAVRSVSTFKADSGDFDYAVYSDNPISNIDIQKNGKVIVGDNKTAINIGIYKDFDEIRTPVIDQPGIYMDQFSVNLTLPEPVADQVQFEVLGIHGVDKTEAYILNSSTIIYKAYGVGPSSTISIVAKLPKGVISYSVVDRILFSLRQFNAQQWIFLSFLIPVISIICIFIVIFRQLISDKVKILEKEVEIPPMAIPPAIVGVIYRQRVTSREIAATIIDLAIRGNIYIMDKERDFAFAQNRLDKRLLSYEKILLSKIFREHIFSNKEEIEKRINSHLYSKKISLFSSGVYNLTTRLGYFRANPQKVHAKYRFGGLMVFFFSLGGFLLSFRFSDYPYLSFIWIGLMVAALATTMVAQHIPMRTKAGSETLSQWLAFKRYLSSRNKMPFSYNNIETFQKYLPYAIVMDCEIAWAKRFSEENFALPSWFIASKGGFSLQDFCLSLFPIISYISRSLAAVREPGFE